MVYFIQRGDHIKIGRTSNLRARMNQLRNGNAEPLTLLGAVVGDAHVEAELHRRFSAHFVSGEWYRAVPEIVEYAEANAIDEPTDRRAYSREFPTDTDGERIKFDADWVPVDLAKRVREKLKTERISLRTIILRLLSDWANH